MVLEMERTATSTPCPIVHLPNKKRRPWLELTVLAGALVGAILYLFSSGASPEAYQLEFNITSDVPFKEEAPRTAHLIILNRNGTVETLEDNRFASAFIDRRSNFRFGVPSPPPSRIFFSPAPPDQLVKITGVRAIGLAGRKVIQVPLDQLVPHRQVEIVAQTPDSLSIKTLPGTQVPMLELKMGAALDFSEEKPSLLSRISPPLRVHCCGNLVVAAVSAKPNSRKSLRGDFAVPGRSIWSSSRSGLNHGGDK